MHCPARERQAGDWYVDAQASVDRLSHNTPASRNDDKADAMTQAACFLIRYQLPTVESHDFFTGQTKSSVLRSEIMVGVP